MLDFAYLALTLLSFAGFALLIGALDKRLAADPDPSDPAEASRDEVDAR